jgi:hypothetical protein
MKKIFILFVVLVMVFAFAIPAAANGFGPGGGMGSGTTQGQPGGRGTYVIVGTITNLGTNSVSINVVRGNRLGQATIGTQVTLNITPQTLFFSRSGTTITQISFADLKVDDQVSVNGIVSNNDWTVYRITVGALLSCLQK